MTGIAGQRLTLVGSARLVRELTLSNGERKDKSVRGHDIIFQGSSTCIDNENGIRAWYAWMMILD